LVGLSSQTILVLGPIADSISCKLVVSTRLQGKISVHKDDDMVGGQIRKYF
jgi:hypothetical protein